MLCAVLLLPVWSQAQTVTSASLTIYRQGQTAPAVAPQTLPMSAFSCDQASAPAGTALNPGGVAFTDPARPGRWCVWIAPANGLFSLIEFDAAQVYDLALAFTNSAGTGPAARAPFTKPGVVPVAPAQLRLTAGQ